MGSYAFSDSSTNAAQDEALIGKRSAVSRDNGISAMRGARVAKDQATIARGSTIAQDSARLFSRNRDIEINELDGGAIAASFGFAEGALNELLDFSGNAMEMARDSLETVGAITEEKTTGASNRTLLIMAALAALALVAGVIK